MKFYTATEIELMDGQKLAPKIFCFMAGEVQGFIAVQSKDVPEEARPEDIPIDMIQLSQVKRIKGAICLNRSSGTQVKYFGGYRF